MAYSSSLRCLQEKWVLRLELMEYLVTCQLMNYLCAKLLPPSGPPPNAVALNPRTHMLKTWKNQGEHQHWTAHLSSMAAPEILIVLGLYGRSRTRTQGESNPRALTRMNKG